MYSRETGLRSEENSLNMGPMRGARCGLRRLRRRVTVLTLVSTLVCTVLPSAIALSQISGDTEWPTYGNDPGGMRYSPLSQINRENVSSLKVAWIFHTGDLSDGTRDRRRSGFEATPILVDGTLYFTTPFNRVIALDPETGKQRWAYDPKIDPTLDYGDGLVNRGVATWLDSRPPSKEPCRRRIYEATLTHASFPSTRQPASPASISAITAR